MNIHYSNSHTQRQRETGPCTSGEKTQPELWDNRKQFKYTCGGSLGREEKNIFKEIMAENFPNSTKDNKS